MAIPAGFDLDLIIPKYHPEIKLLPVRDILECFEAVHSGRADAFMEEIGVVDYIISQRVVPNIHMAFQINKRYLISDLSIGVRANLPLLHSIIQKGLNQISGDELNRIRKKWLLKVHEMYEQSMINLTVAEKRYLFEHNTIKYCVDPSWPPLDFIDQSGKHSGLSADLIKKIAERLGITLELVPSDTWEESLDNIKRGKCDIIPMMNETTETADYLDFTHSYFDFVTVIAARKNTKYIGGYDELLGKELALQSHYFITEYIRTNYPGIKIVEVENTREALKLVSQHKAFATIDGLPTVVNTIETMALENVKIVGSVPQQNSMRLGVRKGNELLYSVFDKAVASLSEQEKVGLYKKWLDIEPEKPFINPSIIYRIGGFFLLIILFLIWRHISLRMYTQKLKTLNQKLHHYSTIDHLTQILNRRSIEKCLTTEMERARLTSAPLTIGIIDIDHFKLINDTYGHIRGDEVLASITNLMTEVIRRNDHVGRWGGEEFLIVLPDTVSEGGGKLVEKFREKIRTHDFGIDEGVSISCGYGQYCPGESLTAFVARVDKGLYRAKEEGRNRAISADPEF